MISILEALDKLQFDYRRITDDMWGDGLRDAMKAFKIHFDLENNDSVDSPKDIIIPQKQWDFTKCRFRCQLCQAGGDWEIPVYYFRCQLLEGYAFNLGKYRNSFFIFIPGKKEGNYSLVSKDGGEWHATDDSVYKKGIDPENSKIDCWKNLNIYLKKLVDLEIAKNQQENDERDQNKVPEGEPDKNPE
jgi:hypothetical protein